MSMAAMAMAALVFRGRGVDVIYTDKSNAGNENAL